MILIKTNGVFYNGLEDTPRLEMIRQNVTSFAEIRSIITATDDKLLEQINKYEFDENRSERTREFKDKKTSTSRSKESWCRVHKTNRHSNEECRAQNQQNGNSRYNKKEENRDSSNQKMFIIQDPKKQDIKSEIMIKFDGFQYPVLIDTGSINSLNAEQLFKNSN